MKYLFSLFLIFNLHLYAQVPCGGPNGSSCSDGNPCTINDTCNNGICEGTSLICDDGNPCTLDSCSVTMGCFYTPVQAGSPCDDGNPCTENDVCINGVCAGTQIVCPDNGDACTNEICIPGIGCTSVPANGAPCDDSDPCTENDICVNGFCSGTLISCPDDGNDCTLEECINGLCVSTPLNGVPCDDGNLCTINDMCNNGICEGTPMICDDGNPCTLDSCSVTMGCFFTPVQAGSPCDDGNPCTENDVCINGVCAGTQIVCPDNGDACTNEICIPGIGCTSVPANGAPCDDSDPCTENDICVNGFCSGTLISCPDDGNDCTLEECINGLCVSTPLNGVPCDDGNLCTINDMCNNGICEGTPMICDDGNPCTLDSCSVTMGCFFTPVQAGSPCDDGNPCTENDVCINGVCAGTQIVCPDNGDACTNEICIPGIGCTSVPANGAPCDDSDPCTENDICVNGFCSGTPISCPDDGNDCTLEECINGLCVSTPLNGVPCDDGNLCTMNDICNNGICEGTPMICNDGNPCTLDSCSVTMGCFFTPVQAGSPCDDGNPCTENDVCINGVCAGTQIVCPDDGNPNTIEICIAGVGCISVPSIINSSYVTNSNDNGSGSLRQNIIDAQNNDTIIIVDLLDTINLHSELEINNKEIWISGAGFNQTILSGQDQTRIFHIMPSGILHIRKTSLINGFSIVNGGAFYNEGVIELKNLELKNNKEGTTAKAFTSSGTLRIVPGTTNIEEDE